MLHVIYNDKVSTMKMKINRIICVIAAALALFSVQVNAATCITNNGFCSADADFAWDRFEIDVTNTANSITFAASLNNSGTDIIGEIHEFFFVFFYNGASISPANFSTYFNDPFGITNNSTTYTDGSNPANPPGDSVVGLATASADDTSGPGTGDGLGGNDWTGAASESVSFEFVMKAGKDLSKLSYLGDIHVGSLTNGASETFRFVVGHCSQGPTGGPDSGGLVCGGGGGGGNGSVPEPATLWLLGAGLLGLAGFSRRRAKSILEA